MYTKRDLYTPKETYIHQKGVVHTPENPKFYSPAHFEIPEVSTLGSRTTEHNSRDYVVNQK